MPETVATRLYSGLRRITFNRTPTAPLRSITSLVGENPPDAATRISPVAMVTGNQVDMEMENRLSGCNAVVNPYVVAIWSEFDIQTRFSLSQLTE